MVDTLFQRALVVRGGALGDFLLTLPVLRTLRDTEPRSRLEVLAYPAIAALAKTAGMIDDVRSIEYGPLAGFFTRGAILDPGLKDYFASFDFILTYLYDPDGIFAGNLRAAGARCVIQGPHRPGEKAHAIDQLAVPLAELGVPLCRRAARLKVTPAALNYPVVALHPGSGNPGKNWPAKRWAELASDILRLDSDLRVAVVGGEADAESLSPLRELADHNRVLWWENLALTDLASRLAGAKTYIGHDTGVSHLAAAVGTPSLLLFGPTDPGVWAPPHDHVRILHAPHGQLNELSFSAVCRALRPLLGSARLASGTMSPENQGA